MSPDFQDKIFIVSQGEIERFDVEINKIQVNISSKYELVKLGDIANLGAGGTPRRGIEEFWKNGTIPWLKSGELKDNLNITEIEEKITEEGLKKSSARLFSKGTLVIAMYGATTGEVGILGIDSTTNQAVCSIIPKIKLNQNYLFWILLLSRKKIKSETFGGAQPNISKEYLENFKIPLSPLEIQNQIVKKMDFALSEKKRKEAEAKNLLESIDDFVLSELGIKYKEVEEKKVFGLSLSELGETKRLDSFYNNPKFLELEKELQNTNVKKLILKDICYDIFSGKRPIGGVQNLKGEIPSIGGEHIGDNGFLESKNMKYISKEFHEKNKSSQLIYNDILIIKDGATTGKVGIYTEDFGSSIININEHVFSLRIKKDINSYYIFCILRTKIGQEQIQREITGATVTGILKESINNLTIPLPTLDIQEKIAFEVKNRIEKAKVLESEAKEVYEKAKSEVEEMILEN